MNDFPALILSNVALAACLAVLTYCLTKLWRSPQLAHTLWLLVLVKLVTPPLVEFPYPQILFSNPADGFGEPGRALSDAPSATDATDPSSPHDPLTDARLLPSNTDRAAPAPQAPVSTHSWRAVLSQHAWWLLAPWAVGTLVFVCVAGSRHARLLRIIAGARTADAMLRNDAQALSREIGLAACPSVCVTDTCVTPLVTIGWRKPIILLPRELLGGLNRDQVRSVLAHEMAHLRRRDHWVRCFETVVLALCWWNPLAWWASRQLRQAEEQCCDAWVVSLLPASRRAYGETLLRTIEFLTEHNTLAAVPGTDFGRFLFKRRIEMILKRNMHSKMPRAAWMVTLSLGALVLPAFLGSPTIARQKENSPAPHRGATQQPGRIFVSVHLREGKVGKNQIIAVDPQDGRWVKMTAPGLRPRVSSDGRKLAFERGDAIWVCSTDGSDDAQPLSNAKGYPVVWSPDGKQLLSSRGVRSEDDTTWEFTTWRSANDATGQTQKTAVPQTDLVWDWSPDGRWIVTTSLRDRPNGKGWQLYLMRPDGSESRALTSSGVNFYPRYSPDGKRIVYIDSSSSKERIKIIGVDGENPTEIFQAKGVMGLDGVCWSPDGKRLVATVFDWHLSEDGTKVFPGPPGYDPRFRFLVMDADGKNPREVTIPLDGGVQLVQVGAPDWR
jgi:beta-lactamase regulating signal transducer with metallopeptidase domain